MRLSVKAKSRMQTPAHYSVLSIKRLAKKRSLASRNPDQDARDAAGFMPRGVSARVLNWPSL